MSKLPVKRSPKPRDNAPTWAGGLAAAILVIGNTLTGLGLSGPAVAILAVVIVLLALASQRFTVPVSDLFGPHADED